MQIFIRKILVLVIPALFAASAGIMAADELTAINADLGKAKSGTAEERLEKLNRIIARYGNSKNQRVQGRVIQAKLDVAGLTEDKENKRQIYEECAELLVPLMNNDPDLSYILAVTLLDLASLENTAAGRARYLVWMADMPVTRRNEHLVARALRMLAADAPTAEEKILGYDKVMEFIAKLEKPGSRTIRQAMHTLKAKAEQLSDPVEKIATCDRLIELTEKSTDTYLQGCLVWAIMHKAKIVSGDDEKIALYERVFTTFENSDNYYLSSRVREAFNLRMKLAGEGSDKTRFYDTRIANLPKKTPTKKFAELQYERAGVAADKSEKAKRYDEVIVQYRGDANPDAVAWAIRAMAKKADLSDSYEQRKTSYDEIVAAFGDSRHATIRHQVAETMNRLARAAGTVEEKIRIYDAIFDRYGKDSDYHVILAVRSALSSKARITGDASALLAFQDHILAVSKDPWMLARALYTKAEYSEAADEKAKYYNQLIEGFADNRDGRVVNMVGSAYLEKAGMTKDATEKIAAYDAVIDSYRRFSWLVYTQTARMAYSGKAKAVGDPSILLAYYDEIIAAEGRRGSVSRAMLDKAFAMEDAAGKEALFGEIIERFGKDEDDDTNEDVLNAIIAKAALTNDEVQRDHLYDLVISDSSFHRQGNLVTLRSVFNEKIRRAEDREEKIRLLDRFIAIAGKFSFDILTMEAMEKRAGLLEGAEARIAAYDEMLEKFGSDKKILPFHSLAGINLAKAELVEGADEKLLIYDKLLAIAELQEDEASHIINRVLDEKAKLIGGESMKTAYHDARILAASTDLVRAKRMLTKIRGLGNDRQSERERAVAGMVELFRDSDDDEIQNLVESAKRLSTTDVLEKDEERSSEFYERAVRELADDGQAESEFDRLHNTFRPGKTRQRGNAARTAVEARSE